MSSCPEGKSSWPELENVEGETAVTTIENENPSVNAVIVLEGSNVTKDFRCDRVRVWVNDDGIVTRIPQIGKSSWPELENVEGETTVVTIENENPSVNAVIVLEGTNVTTDFLCDRVHVWVNDDGIVTRVPQIG